VIGAVPRVGIFTEVQRIARVERMIKVDPREPVQQIATRIVKL